MHLALGKVYRSLGLKRDAVNMYKSALKLNPLALEASIALAELGVGQQDIWSMVSSPTNQDGTEMASSSFLSRIGYASWLETFIAGHTAAQGQRCADAIER